MEQIRTDEGASTPAGAPPAAESTAGPAAASGADVSAARARTSASPRSAPTAAGAAPSGVEPPGSARGEHTHSEPEPPALAAAPQRHSVRAQVLTALRRALLAGELAPGEVYSAPALAARFGVSPTPVREAMQQLAAEGAVETMPNRGFRVCRHTHADAAELREVRAMLEIPAVLHAAAVQPAEFWHRFAELAEATVAAASAGDRTGYAEADRAFHRALVDAAGNRQLADTAAEIHRRAQWAEWTATGPLPRPAARLLAAAAEHRALLEALTADEPERAEDLLRMHLAPEEE